ncbi:hypothetical protein Rcae01_04699 [Novipirellula caenicola]|uniref:Uncharacterized protein n=1 Tax=Novipirellula caenicola TaxID=1536901 RepID=A0ABP9VWJ6_9BACT
MLLSQEPSQSVTPDGDGLVTDFFKRKDRKYRKKLSLY